MKQEFEKFSNICSERLEIWKHWYGVLELIGLLKDFVAVDKEGGLEAHLHAMQRLLPVFCTSGTAYHLRYASWYPEEHPEISKHFQGGKFVTQANGGYFKSVAPDKKLE